MNSNVLVSLRGPRLCCLALPLVIGWLGGALVPARARAEAMPSEPPPAGIPSRWAVRLLAADEYSDPSGVELGLALQRRLSARYALQVGFATKVGHTHSDYVDSSGIGYWNPIIKDRQTDSDPARWRLSARLARYLVPEGRVRMFVSAGPLAGYSGGHSLEVRQDGPDSAASRERYESWSRTLTLGAQVGVGMDAFVRRGLSVGIEYDVQAFWSRLHSWSISERRSAAGSHVTLRGDTQDRTTRLDNVVYLTLTIHL